MSKTPFPVASVVFLDLRMFLAFGGGSGLSRIMPGTCGTLAALPLWWCMTFLPLWAYLALVVASTLIGIHLCEYAAKKLGVHDHGSIVWDEFVGLWITLIAVPNDWLFVVIGFVFFRIFDMLKPWPISWIDKKVAGGFGIMLDDVLAGFAALAATHGVIYVL